MNTKIFSGAYKINTPQWETKKLFYKALKETYFHYINNQVNEIENDVITKLTEFVVIIEALMTKAVNIKNDKNKKHQFNELIYAINIKINEAYEYAKNNGGMKVVN